MDVVAGAPVGTAERVAGFLAWHGLDPREARRLDVGFTSGRPLRLHPGTHVPALQEHVNRFTPVRVSDRSITAPEVIERTHERTATARHPAGGPWRRPGPPRTVLVSVNADPRLAPQSQREAAHPAADDVLRARWRAVEGTVDPQRLAQSASNAVIGDPDDAVLRRCERFDRDDRLALRFDFFRPSGDAVLEETAVFADRVRPDVLDRLGQRTAA